MPIVSRNVSAPVDKQVNEYGLCSRVDIEMCLVVVYESYYGAINLDVIGVSANVCLLG